MDFKKHLPLAFGVLALFVVGFGIPAQAAKARCASEECACEQALRQNTVEALEEFLRKYPHSADNQGSACAALAIPPVDQAPSSTGRPIDESRTIEPDSSPI